MSYHIISIDAPECTLTCRDGRFVCTSSEGVNSIALEDVAAIVITSFSANIHSNLLLEAAKQGVALVLCESFKPASLVLPANRATDTLLTRAQVYLKPPVIKRFWQKTVDAKCYNQVEFIRSIASDHPDFARLEKAASRVYVAQESDTARWYWKIFGERIAETDDFRRGRTEGGVNHLLNYGYAILLSTVLQKLFALGLDPTFGIFHAIREKSTPLAYDLMEPFRPCVDARVTQWIRQHPDENDWQVSKEFRRWITGFTLETVDYLDLTLDIRGCIEGVVRSFRQAILTGQSGPYKPWKTSITKWDGSW
jgi:CRISPR-associated protein Cas1